MCLTKSRSYWATLSILALIPYHSPDILFSTPCHHTSPLIQYMRFPTTMPHIRRLVERMGLYTVSLHTHVRINITRVQKDIACVMETAVHGFDFEKFAVTAKHNHALDILFMQPSRYSPRFTVYHFPIHCTRDSTGRGANLDHDQVTARTRTRTRTSKRIISSSLNLLFNKPKVQ